MGKSGRRYGVGCILLTHNHIGEKIVESGKEIIGVDNDIMFVSHAEIDHLKEKIIDFIKQYEHTIAFVDFIGSSGSYILKDIIDSIEAKTTIVGGLNLPMYLDFLSYRDKLNINDLIEKIVNAGKRSIIIL